MKPLNKLVGFTLMAVLVACLASCSNDLNELKPGKEGSSTGMMTLVPTPDAIAWSGSQIFGNTLSPSTRDNSHFSAEKYQSDKDWPNGPQIDYPDDNQYKCDVNNTEFEYVMSYIKSHPNEGTTTLLLRDFYVQNVGTKGDSYDVNFNPTNGETPFTQKAGPGENHMNFLHFAADKHLNDFNAEGGSWYKITGLEDVNPSYQDSYPNDKPLRENLFRFYYITLPNEEDFGQYKGKTVIYLCFNYWTYKEETPEKIGIIDNDEIYTDWVIKLTPFDGRSMERPEDYVWEDDPNKPGNQTNPGSGTNKYNNNEVEINLALQDVHMVGNAQKYEIADLVSKLSIHVRYPHDVEVILPVPEQLYCDQDDLYILNNHYDDYKYGSYPFDPEFGYAGESHHIEYIVGGETVKLIITYVPASQDNLTNENYVSIIKENGSSENFEGGYISVRTDGINDKVISYCRENYGDGINFEVYNYYNRGNMYTTQRYPEVTYNELQYAFLSRSLVNFDCEVTDVKDKVYPDYYINAFNQVNNQPNPGDCYVWILGDNRAKVNDCSLYIRDDARLKDGTQVNWNSVSRYDDGMEINHFWNAYQGDHFNGSSLNWIYTKKSITGTVNGDMFDNGNWPFTQEGDLSNAPYQYFRFGGNNYFNFKQ